MAAVGINRVHTHNPDGSWTVWVQPPAWSGFKNSSRLTLTDDQYQRYQKWLLGKGEPIQNMLPDLSPGQREMLMSGITPEDWDKAFKEPS